MKTHLIRSLLLLGPAVTLTVTLIAGCAAPRDIDKGPHPVWPAPPASPRIIFRQSIRGPADLAAPSFFDRLGAAIAGDKSRVMVRPHSIAIQDGTRLFVTDQELQGIHVLNLGSSKSGFIARVGKLYFVSPVGVAVCGKNIAVTDSSLRRVFVLTPEGKFVQEIIKPGGFKRPTGLAYDPARQRLLVVDTLANEVCGFDQAGKLVVRFGGGGGEPGMFNFPTHIFLDARGFAYVTDSLNFRMQIFDADGRYASSIGSLGDASGYLAVPKGVAVDRYGHIYIVDSYFSNVQIFNGQGQLLLNIGRPGTDIGEFQVPTGLAIDGQDRVYVCDSHNKRIQVFQYIGGADHEPAQTQPK